MRRLATGVLLFGGLIAAARVGFGQVAPATQPSSAAAATTEPVLSSPATPPSEPMLPPLAAVDATPASHRIAPSIPNDDRVKAAAQQVYLARAGFSPGVIDGKPGRKSKMAIELFQRASGLTATGTMTAETLVALGATDDITLAYQVYTVTAADLKEVTGPIPTDWNERAQLAYSGYADLEEGLAERGWCSPELLRHLNPGITLANLKPGDQVVLPDLTTLRPLRLARLEVDLGEKIVQGFDSSGTQTLLLHCSIARLAEKRPAGELHVVKVAIPSAYTFNPKDWPEVTNVSRVLTIAPGPRCPVGAAWVGLDKPGYGMHGTVRPQDIGKTGSHGCFRLANWDAVRLARSVKSGMTVDVRE